MVQGECKVKNTELVGFRATKEERDKLELLAIGERCSVSEILRILVARVEVRSTAVIALTIDVSKPFLIGDN